MVSPPLPLRSITSCKYIVRQILLKFCIQLVYLVLLSLMTEDSIDVIVADEVVFDASGTKGKIL
jgi:hypothetical protein